MILSRCTILFVCFMLIVSVMSGSNGIPPVFSDASFRPMVEKDVLPDLPWNVDMNLRPEGHRVRLTYEILPGGNPDAIVLPFVPDPTSLRAWQINQDGTDEIMVAVSIHKENDEFVLEVGKYEGAHSLHISMANPIDGATRLRLSGLD